MTNSTINSTRISYIIQIDFKFSFLQEKPPVENDFKLPSGTVLHFTQTHDTLKREDVRDALAALGMYSFFAFVV